MTKITKEAALLYHSQGKPGKIEVFLPNLTKHNGIYHWPTHPEWLNLVWKSRRIRIRHTTIQTKAIW